MIPNINLLPKTHRRGSDSNLLLIVVGVVSAFVLTFFVWQYFSARGDVSDYTKQQQQLQDQLAQLQTELATLTSSIPQGSLEESVSFVERVSYAVSPLIDEAEDLLPNNTYLTNYQFSETAVTIAVNFETIASIAQYVSLLENSPYFNDAQLSTVNELVLAVGESAEADATKEEEKFKEIPRYSTSISLAINESYLANGGVH